MANIHYISKAEDLSLPGLTPYTSLTGAQLRNKLHPEDGIFIAESPKVIRIALAAGYTPVSFLMEEKHMEGQAKDLLEQYPDTPVYTGSRELLASLTGYELTRGVLCAMHRPSPAAAESVCKDARRVAVLQGIADSTNVGALFRSAAALGIDAVLISSDCCDPLCRRSIRVSMGTVFQVPWGKLQSFDQLRELGFTTAALALTDKSVSIDDPALAAEKRLALVLGSEGHGLPDEIIQKCDYTVKIPMYHGVDSLNVAAAGAVAFWQLGKK